MKIKKILIIVIAIVVVFGIIGMFSDTSTNNVTVTDKVTRSNTSVISSDNNEKETINESITSFNNSEKETISSNIIDDRYHVGETFNMEAENGARQSITITEWGYDYNYDNSIYCYFIVNTENTGSETFAITASMFKVYADEYAVDQLYGISSHGEYFSATVSADRKATGTIYLNIDPNTVSVIEVEFGDVIVVLKDDTLYIDNDLNKDFIYDENGNIYVSYYAGKYNGSVNEYNNLIFSVYSSIDSNIVGNIEVLYNGAVYKTTVEPLDKYTYKGMDESSGKTLTYYIGNEQGNSFIIIEIDGQEIDEYYYFEEAFES